MKLQKISLIASCLMLFTIVLSGQKKASTKVVVIERVVDENGKIVETRIEKAGEEAEKYLEQNGKELEIEIDKRVEPDLKEKEVIMEFSTGDTIRRIERNEYFQEITEEKTISLDVEGGESREERKIKIRVRNDDGEIEVMEWNGDGEIPSKMKEVMEKENLEVNVEMDDEEEIRVSVTSSESGKLGVEPVNRVEGVEVRNIEDSSVAAKGGLQEGDIIYQWNKNFIGSTLQLKHHIDQVSTGEKIKVKVLRDGKEKELVLQF